MERKKIFAFFGSFFKTFFFIFIRKKK